MYVCRIYRKKNLKTSTIFYPTKHDNMNAITTFHNISVANDSVFFSSCCTTVKHYPQKHQDSDLISRWVRLDQRKDDLFKK